MLPTHTHTHTFTNGSALTHQGYDSTVYLYITVQYPYVDKSNSNGALHHKHLHGSFMLQVNKFKVIL